MTHPVRPQAAISLLTAGNLAIWVAGGARFALGSWLALELTADPAAPVWLLIAELTPTLCLAPVFGLLIDRLDRRRLAACVDAVRALAATGVAVSAATGRLDFWTLVGLAAVAGAGDQLSTPSRTALVRQLSAEGQLLSANARISVTTQLGSMAGVAAGGVAADSVPAATAFAAIAACYLISLCLLLAVRTDSRTAAARPVTPNESILAGFRTAMGHVRAAGGWSSPFLVVIVLAAFIKTYNSLLPAFSHEVMHFGSAQFGALDAAYAVGGLTAGLALVRLTTARSDTGSQALQRQAHTGLVVLAVLTGVFAFSGGFGMALALYCGIGAAFQTLTVYMVACQTLVPLSVYGRVFSGFNFVGTVLVLVLYGTVSAALHVVSPTLIYLLLAVVLACLAIVQARAAAENGGIRRPTPVGRPTRHRPTSGETPP
ncbi:MFS transporter [Streptomyces sp. W16]|uniref:MFS transporter n=1 Tax=Streptomyces sp. W16 TaxID=3076631 RepID=UPI00295B36B7|nr:MFS transporter [Streptomyces sp. W16]MDV9173629.1 MFS transporter [Streptomyces sp. W16]